MTTENLSPSQLDRKAFTAIYGGVYEHSPWVAESLAAQGLTPADDEASALAGRMAAIVEAGGPARQLELLRCHPELVSKTRIGEELTESSKREQSGARLDQCSPEEFARFNALNDTYRTKFGFPFIIAVTGLSREEILGAFEARVGHSLEEEFRAALDEVHKIARIRIEAIARLQRAGTIKSSRTTA